jgi:hypothetical protein
VLRIAMLVGAAAVLLGTAAKAQEVSYDLDKTADFTALRSYAWVSGTPVRDELNDRRIVEAVSQQLEAKGLFEVSPEADPDLLVAYHAGVSRDLEVNGTGWAYRPAGRGSARVEEVLVGTLVVDVMDARTGKVIWRGVATKDLDTRADPEKREKNLDRAAEKMFKHYPVTIQ